MYPLPINHFVHGYDSLRKWLKHDSNVAPQSSTDTYECVGSTHTPTTNGRLPARPTPAAAHAQPVIFDGDDFFTAVIRILDRVHSKWLGRIKIPLRILGSVATFYWGTIPAGKELWCNVITLRKIAEQLHAQTMSESCKQCLMNGFKPIVWLTFFSNLNTFFGTGLMGIGLLNLWFLPAWATAVIRISPVFIFTYSVVEIIKDCLEVSNMSTLLDSTYHDFVLDQPCKTLLEKKRFWHSMRVGGSWLIGMGILMSAVGMMWPGLALLLLGTLFGSIVKAFCIDPCTNHPDMIQALQQRSATAGLSYTAILSELPESLWYLQP